MSKTELSTLARFDSLIKELSTLESTEEFLSFSLSQEDCRQKWLACQSEIENLKKKIEEAKNLQGRYEARNHHLNDLLKYEIRERISYQKEKKKLENQLELLRSILTQEGTVSENTKDRLQPILLQTRKRKSNDELFLKERLETIQEASLTSSVKLDHDPSEELELSGLVRSYREYGRPSGHSREIEHDIDDALDEDNSQDSGSQSTLASNQLYLQENYPTKATSSSNFPEYKLDTRDELIEKKFHFYKQQIIIYSAVNCCVCEQRIKFGRAALKCVNCLQTCHIDCRDKIPSECSSFQTKKNKRPLLSFFPSLNLPPS